MAYTFGGKGRETVPRPVEFLALVSFKAGRVAAMMRR